MPGVGTARGYADGVVQVARRPDVWPPPARATRRAGRGRAWWALAVVVLAAAYLWASGDLGGPPPWARDVGAGDDAARAGAEAWRVVSVTDGDTLTVERDGVEEHVRLLGIDTPEREECGYAEARALMTALVGTGPVTLVQGSADDRDRYGRLLRFVDVATPDGTVVDVGLRQLEAGLAAEVYDSRTGYAEHDREAAYVAADEAAPDVCPDLREH